MSQQTALYEKLFENPEEVNNRAESLKYLTLRQNSLSIVAVSTFFCLIFSIFSSMAYIARNSQYEPTDTWATFGFLFVPLLFTMVAILLLILAFTVLPSTPELEGKKTE
jgi:TRAP-type C4-dicarboxylate transport system permease small subunit